MDDDRVMEQQERPEAVTLGEHLERAVIDLQQEITRLQAEVEALKLYLAMVFPGFARRFPRIRERAMRVVEPDSHKQAAASD